LGKRSEIKAILVPNLNAAIIIAELLQCCDATVKHSADQQITAIILGIFFFFLKLQSEATL